MRVARQTIPGAVHHVITRFVDRRWFFTEEAERRKYLDYLGRALDDSTWRCLAYALMSNHTHLVMLGGEEPPEYWTKSTHSPFALWMNKRAERLGPLIADRPTIRIVPPRRVAHVVAYVHNNPVRARVVERAADSTWTSHRAYLGLDAAPPWLAVREAYARCGFAASDPATFGAWIDAHASMESMDPDPELLAALGKQAHRLGGVEPATPIVTHPVRAQCVVRPHSWLRPDPAALVHLVAQISGVRREAMTARRPTPELYAARRLALLAGRELGISAADVAAALAMRPQSASRVRKGRVTDEERALVQVVLRRAQDEVLTTVQPSPLKRVK